MYPRGHCPFQMPNNPTSTSLLKVFFMVYKDIVLYCMGYSIYHLLSHILSRHLNGAVLETLSRPSLLITDAYNALNVQARRRERDTQLMSMWTYCTTCNSLDSLKVFIANNVHVGFAQNSWIPTLFSSNVLLSAWTRTLYRRKRLIEPIKHLVNFHHPGH